MKAKYAKASWFFLLFSLVKAAPAFAQSFAGRTVTGEELARQQVRRAVENSTDSHFRKPILSTKALAIAVAEPIVFQVYGRKHILAQQPYEAYLIDGFWYVTGTLPKGYLGGTFEIILAASDGRVVYLVHGQ